MMPSPTPSEQTLLLWREALELLNANRLLDFLTKLVTLREEIVVQLLRAEKGVRGDPFINVFNKIHGEVELTSENIYDDFLLEEKHQQCSRLARFFEDEYRRLEAIACDGHQTPSGKMTPTLEQSIRMTKFFNAFQASAFFLPLHPSCTSVEAPPLTPEEDRQAQQFVTEKLLPIQANVLSESFLNTIHDELNILVQRLNERKDWVWWWPIQYLIEQLGWWEQSIQRIKEKLTQLTALRDGLQGERRSSSIGVRATRLDELLSDAIDNEVLNRRRHFFDPRTPYTIVKLQQMRSTLHWDQAEFFHQRKELDSFSTNMFLFTRNSAKLGLLSHPPAMTKSVLTTPLLQEEEDPPHTPSSSF